MAANFAKLPELLRRSELKLNRAYLTALAEARAGLT